MKKITPMIGTEQIALLEKCCNAVGVSGAEGEIRKIIFAELEAIADEIKVDSLGNVLVTRLARKGEKPMRVMLDAHMDEVGFMIVADEGDGLYSFVTVGGIDERQLPGKPVWVGSEHLPGVIGAKPIHLTTHDELNTAIPLDSLRIDLGPGGAGKVKPGDFATFATNFMQIGPSLRAKALDDRLGVTTLIELIKHAPENVTLLASFAVQEEIGGRGARVAAYTLDPDLAIAVDSTPAFDLPREDGEENTVYNCRVGAGPAIYIADSGTLSDPRLIRFISQTAEKHNIPYQYRQPGGGGTDASTIHKVRSGIPSVSISIPGRYAHTANLLAALSDWENTLQLLHTVLENITPSVLSVDRD
jgi:tetrahedral aminopeptidase